MNILPDRDPVTPDPLFRVRRTRPNHRPAYASPTWPEERKRAWDREAPASLGRFGRSRAKRRIARKFHLSPQVIFFMTDGASPGTTEEDIRQLGNRAKSLNVTINTMAMMEPDAAEGMMELAKRSGGSFAIIEADGSVRDVPVK